jgi:hypothetical protein
MQEQFYPYPVWFVRIKEREAFAPFIGAAEVRSAP